MKTVFETKNYAVINNEKKKQFELVRKALNRTMFLNSSKLQTPLIIAAKKLEERR